MRAAVIARDGACRACGLPADLANLLEADHIDPGNSRESLDLLQCLCRFCNNAKNAAKNVPELAIRAPEYDFRKITENQNSFNVWLDNFRPMSQRKALRIAKRERAMAKIASVRNR